ncbi:MAG: type II secretion system protein [Phycisphaerae bacterium]|nr:type II secretion system protein [Phycisphaerae bacterium]
MKKKEGFTLIELLVVISIIALLVSILMPALARARELARQTYCLSNQSQMSKAWLMYADDNDGRMVSANTYANGWADMPRNPPGTSTDPGTGGMDLFADLVEKQNAVKRGKLFQYLNNIEVYNCPSDRRTFRAGKTSWRSYSILDGLNASYNTTPVYKIDAITMPSDKIIFTEELDGRGFNWGSWAIGSPHNKSLYSWVDVPASYHKIGSTSAWGDGHAEMIKWKDPRTIKIHAEVERGAFGAGSIPNSYSSTPTNNEDILYLKQHWPRTK